MVAGSRLNHYETDPPLIEIKVYHFSAAQGGVVVNTAETTNDGVDTGKSGGVAVVKCFIDTAAYDARPSFGLLPLLWILGTLGMLRIVAAYRHSKRNGSYYTKPKN